MSPHYRTHTALLLRTLHAQEENSVRDAFERIYAEAYPSAQLLQKGLMGPQDKAIVLRRVLSKLLSRSKRVLKETAFQQTQLFAHKEDAREVLAERNEGLKSELLGFRKKALRLFVLSRLFWRLVPLHSVHVSKVHSLAFRHWKTAALMDEDLRVFTIIAKKDLAVQALRCIAGHRRNSIERGPALALCFRLWRAEAVQKPIETPPKRRRVKSRHLKKTLLACRL